MMDPTVFSKTLDTLVTYSTIYNNINVGTSNQAKGTHLTQLENLMWPLINNLTTNATGQILS